MKQMPIEILNQNIRPKRRIISGFVISKMFQIWNRILAEKEMLKLAKCEGDIQHGKMVSWSESKHLWKWSNIAVEEFKKGADRTLCGKPGYA